MTSGSFRWSVVAKCEVITALPVTKSFTEKFKQGLTAIMDEPDFHPTAMTFSFQLLHVPQS